MNFKTLALKNQLTLIFEYKRIKANLWVPMWFLVQPHGAVGMHLTVVVCGSGAAYMVR